MWTLQSCATYVRTCALLYYVCGTRNASYVCDVTCRVTVADCSLQHWSLLSLPPRWSDVTAAPLLKQRSVLRTGIAVTLFRLYLLSSVNSVCVFFLLFSLSLARASHHHAHFTDKIRSISLSLSPHLLCHFHISLFLFSFGPLF